MDFLTALMNWVADIPAWIVAVTAVVTAANAITVLTPTKIDNKIVDKLLWVLNFLSMNFGKNKNADA